MTANKKTSNSANIKTKFTKWGTDHLIYILSFLIPFLIMMIIFIVQEIYPFGDRSFLHVDMYHQYFPFLNEFYDKLKNGESLLYSWNTGIGSNFLALFVYYLSSPLNWLVVFFPENLLIEFMSYLVVLKIGLCGLTFSFYLKRHFQIKHIGIVFFAVFYALSGYMAAYNWNVMWLDCIVLAPLIILGLEQLVKEGKSNFYCITLALSIFSNYYISIMICLFLVLYFFILLLTAEEKWKAISRFTIYSLLAGGMAAVLLIPELEMLSLTEFSNSNFPSKLTSYFSIFDVLARHFANVSVEIGLAHWPNLYCGVAALFLLPLYFMNKKIPVKEKFAKGLLLAFFLLSFSYNMLDFIWHGFNYPDSLPARQSFLYIFLLLTLCYEAFLHLKEFSKRDLSCIFVGAGIFVILCEKIVTEEAFTSSTFLVTGFALLLYGVLLYLYCNGRKAAKQLAIAGLILITLEASINTAVTSVPTVSRTNYLSNHDSYKALVARAREKDPDFYRMDKYARLTQNDAMLLGYHSASLFSSTSNALVKNFYEKYGMKSSRVYYSFEGATPFVSALLANKYMFSSTEKEPDSFYHLADQEGDIYLYENTYTLPLGYVIAGASLVDSTDDTSQTTVDTEDTYIEADSEEQNLYDLSELFGSADDAHSVIQDEIEEHPLEKSLNPVEKQNLLAARLGLENPLFEEVPSLIEAESTDISVVEDSRIYAYIDSPKVTEVTATANGNTTTFKKLKNNYILDLGRYPVGSTISLSTDNDASLSLTAYALKEESLKLLLDELKEQPLIIDSYDSTTINGHVKVTNPGSLILSVPYEAGWRVLVDGKESEISLFEDTMICVPLTEGEHTITLSFYPNSFTVGILISIFCLAIFLSLVYLKKRGFQGKRSTSSTEKTNE